LAPDSRIGDAPSECHAASGMPSELPLARRLGRAAFGSWLVCKDVRSAPRRVRGVHRAGCGSLAFPAARRDLGRAACAVRLIFAVRPVGVSGCLGRRIAPRDLHLSLEDTSTSCCRRPRSWRAGSPLAHRSEREVDVQSVGAKPSDSSLGVRLKDAPPSTSNVRVRSQLAVVPAWRGVLRTGHAVPGACALGSAATSLRAFGPGLRNQDTFRPCRFSRLRRLAPRTRCRFVAPCSRSWGSPGCGLEWSRRSQLQAARRDVPGRPPDCPHRWRRCRFGSVLRSPTSRRVRARCPRPSQVRSPFEAFPSFTAVPRHRGRCPLDISDGVAVRSVQLPGRVVQRCPPRVLRALFRERVRCDRHACARRKLDAPLGLPPSLPCGVKGT